MAIRLLAHSLVVFLLAAIPALASAAPVAFDGRYYEVVVASGVTWADADTGANGKVCGPTCGSAQNVAGHLATIGTATENAFIQTLNNPPGSRTELWIGGFQQSGAAEPGGGWQWVNGDSIPPPTPSQTFGWLPGEPSNGPGGAEQHLTFGRGGVAGWNDNDKTNNIWGYVVEYGDKLAPKLADTCALDATDPDGPGCPLQLNGTKITLPLTRLQINDLATIIVSTQLIKNDAARCGKNSLFLDNGAVEVPAYLCGHPDFLVAKVEGAGFEINQGVVTALNDNNVLPGNLYECLPSGANPTEADVVGYQSSQNMLEAGFTTGIADDFVGSVGEFTDLCGSSRGTLPGRSWYFAGLRIYLGAVNPIDPSGSLLAIHQRLVELVVYKLNVLGLAVQNACQRKTFSNGDCSSMGTQVKNIIGDLSKANYGEASAHLKNLQKFVRAAKFKVIPGSNDSGELTSRINNLIFTMDVKVIPFAP